MSEPPEYVEIEKNYWEKELGGGTVDFIDNRSGSSIGSYHRPTVDAFDKHVSQVIKEEHQKKSKLYKLLRKN